METDEYVQYVVNGLGEAALQDALREKSASATTRKSFQSSYLSAVLKRTATELATVDEASQNEIARRIARLIGVPRHQEDEFSIVVKAGSVDSFMRIAIDIENLIDRYRQNQDKK